MTTPKFAQTNVPGYVKDPSTNVVINTDAGQYETFIRQRDKSKEFNQMKAELTDIKALLQEILSKQSGN